MNDKSQKEIHSGKDVVLEPYINHTEEGYQGACPTCPWTSGIREYKDTVKLLYSRHLDYVAAL